jgi:hypothetical protein
MAIGTPIVHDSYIAEIARSYEVLFDKSILAGFAGF